MEEDVRLYVGGMPMLTELCLVMKIDPLEFVRGVSEFVTVIYDATVTFAFPDPKVGTYRKSVLYLIFISVVEYNQLVRTERVA